MATAPTCSLPGKPALAGEADNSAAEREKEGAFGSDDCCEESDIK